MRNSDFRNSKQETPAENGVYDWRIMQGCEAMIDYIDGVWISKAGHKMPENMKIMWR
jgi:hypothetical protein